LRRAQIRRIMGLRCAGSHLTGDRKIARSRCASDVAPLSLLDSDPPPPSCRCRLFCFGTCCFWDQSPLGPNTPYAHPSRARVSEDRPYASGVIQQDGPISPHPFNIIRDPDTVARHGLVCFPPTWHVPIGIFSDEHPAGKHLRGISCGMMVLSHPRRPLGPAVRFLREWV
jgi:hypothetical protein